MATESVSNSSVKCDPGGGPHQFQCIDSRNMQARTGKPKNKNQRRNIKNQRVLRLILLNLILLNFVIILKLCFL